MKKQNNQPLQTILLAAITTIFLLSASVSTFAQSVGAKYGTRDPRTCADTKAPTKGAMTAALATKYVICFSEGVQGDYLYLVEGITTVQVGGGVPYNPKTYINATDVDVKALVYPFRTGGYKSYQCGAVTETSENKGYNCAIYTYPKATGVCMKTTFGDWSCTLDYQTPDRNTTENNMPPPTAAKVVSATAKPNAPPAKNGNQTAGKTTETNADKGETDAEAGLPMPDFSDMEKYFDISKVEYTPTDRGIYFIGKMTKKVNANDFEINFYDADGIKVIPTNTIVPWSGDYSEVGDIAKYTGNLPPESKWKFVKKVVITRHIY